MKYSCFLCLFTQNEEPLWCRGFAVICFITFLLLGKNIDNLNCTFLPDCRQRKWNSAQEGQSLLRECDYYKCLYYRKKKINQWKFPLQKKKTLTFLGRFLSEFMLHCPLPPPIPTPHPDHPHYSQVIQTCLELHTCVFFVWKPRMGGKSNQVLARARHALEMGIRQSLDRFHSFFFFFFSFPDPLILTIWSL